MRGCQAAGFEDEKRDHEPVKNKHKGTCLSSMSPSRKLPNLRVVLGNLKSAGSWSEVEGGLWDLKRLMRAVLWELLPQALLLLLSHSVGSDSL